MKKLFVLLFCVSLVGCESPSMNIQRSASRDVGDTGITLYLENEDVGVVGEKKAKVLLIIQEIENFINNGEIGNLTVGTIRDRINKIVPSEYQNISNTILQYLSEFKVPTDKIPPTAVKNIKAVLIGMKIGIDEYKLEDRKTITK